MEGSEGWEGRGEGVMLVKLKLRNTDEADILDIVSKFNNYKAKWKPIGGIKTSRAFKSTRYTQEIEADIGISQVQLDKIVEIAEVMRKEAVRVGSLHAYWNIIYDVNDILRGEETVMTAKDIITQYEHLVIREGCND